MKQLNRRLRHRVDIEERVLEKNSDGARTEAWVTVRDSEEPLIPAEIVPLSGREFLAAQAVQSGVNTRITIRATRAIRATQMRVVHGADIYNIKAVMPDPTLLRHLTLMCELGVNHG